LIDEASQVPVSTAAAYFLLAKETANLVLAGDHRQLGPIYKFQMQDSSQGLFDCIFSYMRESHQLEPTALDQNYRTNIEISDWPKERFYPEGYEAFQPQRRLDITLSHFSATQPPYWPAQLPWSGELLHILDPNVPIVVITYDAQSYTVSNPFEAQIVAALTYLYRLALKHNGDCPSSEDFGQQFLGIVTPHRAQMSNIRNLLIETSALSAEAFPIVDTVDRFQGQERNLIISSYAVADKDFVRLEEEFILNPRRFNVTLTRARSKFIMLVSEAIVQYLPDDAKVAEDAAHLQLFVENYCSSVDERINLPFFDSGVLSYMKCRLRGRM
jgi:superfamily I DNA and/or RNA helicase